MVALVEVVRGVVGDGAREARHPGRTPRLPFTYHRLKQTPGWKLIHIWPGLLVWITPSGTWRIVRPDRL